MMSATGLWSALSLTRSSLVSDRNARLRYVSLRSCSCSLYHAHRRYSTVCVMSRLSSPFPRSLSTSARDALSTSAQAEEIAAEIAMSKREVQSSPPRFHHQHLLTCPLTPSAIPSPHCTAGRPRPPPTRDHGGLGAVPRASRPEDCRLHRRQELVVHGPVLHAAPIGAGARHAQQRSSHASSQPDTSSNSPLCSRCLCER